MPKISDEHAASQMALFRQLYAKHKSAIAAGAEMGLKSRRSQELLAQMKKEDKEAPPSTPKQTLIQKLLFDEFKDPKDPEEAKLEFFAEYAQNGGDIYLTCERVDVKISQGRQWILERNAELERQNSKEPKPANKYTHTISSGKERSHFVIPDVQAKPGQDFTFLERVGMEIVESQPDVVICIGDFSDMQSLCSYDIGKRSYEGRRYQDDVRASKEANTALFKHIRIYNAKQRDMGLPEYLPEYYMFLGNHEDRINRVTEEDPRLYGTIDVKDLAYESFGWKVFPFLEVAIIDGVAYSHYFTSGVMGRPVSSARAMLTKKHMSCVQGHVQGVQMATDNRGDGRPIIGLFVSCCNEHDEAYLGPQGNSYWRGVWLLYEVEDGSFSFKQISLKHLKKKFPLPKQ